MIDMTASKIYDDNSSVVSDSFGSGRVETGGSVTSRDGTTIGYRQLGQGPGVVVLHGAMESAQSHMLLAEALSDAFTVYVPDRRVHSLGFPFAKDYDIQKEVEDLDALLIKTGSHNVFGVSSGGIICLRAALVLRNIDKAGVYEPPLSFTSSGATVVLRRFDDEMANGRVGAALITGMKASQMGPPVLKLVPRRLLEYFTNKQIKKQEKARDGDVSLSTIAPTLHYDFSLVAEMSGKLEEFRNVSANVLLLGGSKSPGYLKIALDSLEKILPHVRRIEFPGLDHGGSSDPSPFNRRGNPQLVAQELRMFYVQ